MKEKMKVSKIKVPILKSAVIPIHYEEDKNTNHYDDLLN